LLKADFDYDRVTITPSTAALAPHTSWCGKGPLAQQSKIVRRGFLPTPAIKVHCHRAISRTGLSLRSSEEAEPTKGDQKMGSTKDVVDNHLKSFGERDLKGILSDYGPGAVLFTPEGPLRGIDAIRPFFQAMLAEFGKPGAAFSLKQQFVEGDYAYILWTAETADNVYELGTDTFVVRDGKIVAQSFTGKITPKG
jgi:ketosteroid isomerase-like protein